MHAVLAAMAERNDHAALQEALHDFAIQLLGQLGILFGQCVLQDRVEVRVVIKLEGVEGAFRVGELAEVLAGERQARRC